jgi:peptidoglycan/LPS O-acetylase OafA/YrhL
VSGVERVLSLCCAHIACRFVAFMVLWDHFHPMFTPSGRYIHTPLAWLADNYLFVALSGFTTVLQLRESISVSNDKSDDSSPAPTTGFDWKSFLTARALGIFPIYWLALLINAPRWHLQNSIPQRGPNETPIQAGGGFAPNSTPFTRAVCAALYPVGMQTYYTVECQVSGES